MRVENQTQEVFASLYNATKMFTEQLQPHYYKQFRGDVEDLASDFYMEFIEPKGAEHKTLIDRYDRESVFGKDERHWHAYVKTAVTRALIDESRTHPWSVISMELLLDEYGDSERVHGAMCDDGGIDDYDYEGMCSTMASRIKKMTPKQFLNIKNKYLGVRSVLDKGCVRVMDVVMNPRVLVSTTAGMLPVYRVQSGEVMAAYMGKLESFSVQTGKPVRMIGVELTPAGMLYIGEYPHFKVDESKAEFLAGLK